MKSKIINRVRERQRKISALRAIEEYLQFMVGFNAPCKHADTRSVAEGRTTLRCNLCGLGKINGAWG